MVSDNRFWQVQAVFGCVEDPGPGFAYTMGLATRGLLELHMWDRPTHGDDPGADFNLSSRDLCHILNEFADEWVAGSLQVGDERTLSLDEGLTTAVVSFGEPVDADSVEAWGVRPSRVVPLRWSLQRPARGAPVEIMPGARDAYEREVRGVASHCDPRVTVSGTHLPGSSVTFDVDGQYGPLSSLVEVHARAVAGVADVRMLMVNVWAAQTVISPGSLVGKMTTMSRLSGRDEQLEQVYRLADRVMDRLVKRRDWRDMVAETASARSLPLVAVQQHLRRLVQTSTTSMLMAVALDDVLPDAMVLAAQGPWRATLSGDASDPGQRWRCSPAAEQAVRRMFSSMDGLAFRRAVEAMSGPVAELMGGDMLRVHGLALTGPVAPPPVGELVLTPLRGALVPEVLTSLSLLAELVTTVIDGAFELDDCRRVELEIALGWAIDECWWDAA